jgi:hypothetical protein
VTTTKTRRRRRRVDVEAALIATGSAPPISPDLVGTTQCDDCKTWFAGVQLDGERRADSSQIHAPALGAGSVERQIPIHGRGKKPCEDLGVYNATREVRKKGALVRHRHYLTGCEHTAHSRPRRRPGPTPALDDTDAELTAVERGVVDKGWKRVGVERANTGDCVADSLPQDESVARALTPSSATPHVATRSDEAYERWRKATPRAPRTPIIAAARRYELSAVVAEVERAREVFHAAGTCLRWPVVAVDQLEDDPTTATRDFAPRPRARKPIRPGEWLRLQAKALGMNVRLRRADHLVIESREWDDADGLTGRWIDDEDGNEHFVPARRKKWYEVVVWGLGPAPWDLPGDGPATGPEPEPARWACGPRLSAQDAAVLRDQLVAEAGTRLKALNAKRAANLAVIAAEIDRLHDDALKMN